MSAIYISKQVNNLYKAQMNLLAAQYEAKYQDPNVLYHFTGHAFIDWKLHVQFIDGIPSVVRHNGIQIGEKCSLIRNSPTDQEFPIDKSTEFNEFLKTHKNFILQVGSFSDGCTTIQLAKTFDVNGELVDFSRYD